MKKLSILLLTLASVLVFTQCNTPSSDKLLENPATRGQIISSLMNNDDYMNEVMDSMKSKHPDNMMGSMMDMCKSDSSMCKMMMGKTMDMCDADSSKCKMMMGSMQSHPKAMKSMQDMGMCDMKDMKMDGMKNMKGMGDK